MDSSARRVTHAAAWLVLAVAGIGFGLAYPSPAGAIEHPPIEVTEVDMVPERGWGVSGQNPSTTQTETLDVLVWDMVQSGDRMFVGGAFLNVQNGSGGTPISQPYLAAFDVATGEWVSTFRPSFDRAIYALEVLPNGSVLVGGEFENVNGTTRRGLVALDEVTGEIDPTFAGAVDRPWSNRRATIRDMEVEAASGRIYVAGSFSHLDGAGGSRTEVSKAGRFSNALGVIDAAWKPIVSGGAVWGLDTDPSRGEVVMSGWFTSVNGQSGTGHFEVVDDQTGAYVPGKIELTKNDGGAQPETYDTVYGNGIVLMIGEQHMVQVLDADNHQMIGYHATGYTSGFQWRGGFAGGAFQAGEVIGDVIIVGCHCTSGGDNLYESFTGRRTNRYNVIAINATTGRHIEGFDADIDSPGDGHWAAASDTNGCLWIGGDYHVGGNQAGRQRWVGGFARLCTPIPPINIENPGDQIGRVGDDVSLQITASGGRNATFGYSATGLPFGLSIDTDTGLITGTINQIGASEVTISVDAVEGEGRSASRVFQWSVMDDEAPVIAPIGRRAVFSGRAVEVEINATDTENSSLSWTATGLPAGLAINPNTGTIANNGQQGAGPMPPPGIYTVAVTATDLIGLSDTETFTLRVIEPPVTDAITSYSGYEVASGDFYLGWRFTVDEPTIVSELGIYDADNSGTITNNGVTTAGLYNTSNRQRLAQVDIPSNAPIQNGAAYAALDNSVTLQPGIVYAVAAEISGESFGRYTGNLTTAAGINYVGGVYKWGSSAGYPSTMWNGQNSFIGGTFRIGGDTLTPTINPTADQISAADIAESVALTADNPGGGDLTWTASGLPDGMTIDTATGLITGTPTTIGAYTVAVTVTNDIDLADSDSFNWTVTDAVAPELNAIADQAVAQFDPVAIETPVTQPEAGLQWTATGLPAGTLINAATGTITGNVTDSGSFNITVTVTDIVGLSDSESFTLQVVRPSHVDAIASYTGFQTNGGSWYLGWRFTVDETTTVSELGIFDASGDGRINNNGATTAGLYNTANGQTLAQIDIPANTPLENGVAYAAIANPVTLQPGTTYIVAAEISGERYGRYTGSLATAPGVNYVGGAYRSGSSAGYPNRFWEGENSFIGGTFRILGDAPVPTLDPIDDQSAFIGIPQTLTPTVDNPGGGALTWTASGLPTGLTIDAGTGVITGTPSAIGVFSAAVTVTDNGGLADSETFTWTITNNVDPGGGNNGGGDDLLVDSGSDWRYDDTGTDLGDTWSSPAFDDGAWPTASAEFGFGDGDETTLWTSGTLTYYARSEFEFTGDIPASLALDLKADDGAVVYLNGVEILRDNMPIGPITASTPADSWRSGDDEDFHSHVVSSEPLVVGTNLIAVEVHNVWARNNDLSFDLILKPSDEGGVERPPIDLVEPGASWAHTDSADGQPAGWPGVLAGAPVAAAEFGFGDDDETTVLTAGEDSYYFSRSFNVDDVDQFGDLTLRLAADDGAVVYLNGIEIHRYNMPAGAIAPDTRPITWVAGADETFQTSTVASDALQLGANVISVEVHNLWPNNNDLTFDLHLSG